MSADLPPTPTSASHGGMLIWGMVTTLFVATVLTVGIWSSDHQGSTFPGKSATGHQMTTSEYRPNNRPKSIPSHSSFETGMVYPRWSPAGYGPQDSEYAPGLAAISAQTHARWLEMPLLFKMATPESLTFDENAMATPQSFEAGIALAHQEGFSVFVVPLVTVAIPGGWSGSVRFPTQEGAVKWFEAYYQAYAPYLLAAQRQHVEQLSIGTELAWMQRNASDGLWHNYLLRVREKYTGILTYDTNWSNLGDPIEPWMRSLDTLGVSEYIPLVPLPAWVAPKEMPILFRAQVQAKLDAFSVALGKPILVSEIGYRRSYDALFQPWDSSTHLPLDTREQASIYQVALSILAKDSHIRGAFCWGWNDTGAFDLHDSQAAMAIGEVYQRI